MEIPGEAVPLLGLFLNLFFRIRGFKTFSDEWNEKPSDQGSPWTKRGPPKDLEIFQVAMVTAPS
jgi:hypothetical protein